MLQVDPRALKVGALTPQERQCLRLVAQNRSSKEIAAALGISKASVDTYCNRARVKLGAPNRRAAARMMTDAEPGAAMAPVPPAVAEPAAPAPIVRVVLLPPLSELGLWWRIRLIILGAVVLALAFGMLMTGLGVLDDLSGGALAKAVRQAPVTSVNPS
jgi:DNA-binding CsgD family transcriptional regulator